MNLSGISTATWRQTRQGFYFFLSYAHSAPMAENLSSETDAWVSVFFDDLRTAVAQNAHPRTGMDIGFFDQQISPTSDLKAELSRALGQAEVFVPLYSPGYFAKAWPLRERGVFQERLAASVIPSSDQHLIPVLWTPIPSWRKPAGADDALELGAGIEEYAENGVRALRMLGSYKEVYRKVLARLARKIVVAAERYPIGPSAASDLDQVDAQVPDDPAFIVTALTSETPLGSPPDADSGSGVNWRPFGDRQALPIAEYAASTAERLGLQTQVMSFDRMGTMVDRSPVIVIVDPQLLADTAGEALLRTVFADQPEWVVPLVVSNQDRPQYSQATPSFADRTVTLIESVRETTAARTDGLEELVAALPRVITRARRAYLKRGQVWPPTGSGTPRPRLGSPNKQPSNERRTDVDE